MAKKKCELVTATGIIRITTTAHKGNAKTAYTTRFGIAATFNPKDLKKVVSELKGIYYKSVALDHPDADRITSRGSTHYNECEYILNNNATENTVI